MVESSGKQLRLVDEATLAIGDLAERTGVNTATLRMWETRYGFPEPLRRRSGHRRYRESDVELVLRVLQLREDGVRLDAAIDQITSRAAHPGQTGSASPDAQASRDAHPASREARDTRDAEAPSDSAESRSAAPAAVAATGPIVSVFAAVRARHPEAAPQRLRKETLSRLSWAIEDEFCARARPGLVFGFFQQPRFYRAARNRWQQIDLLAGAAYAFAEFSDDDLAGSNHGPHLVPLAPRHAMTREWSLVADGAGFPVALVAWELPGQRNVADRDRLFEAVLTVDPATVRVASQACAEVAVICGAPRADEAVARLAEPVEPDLETDAVTGLFNRVLAYHDGNPR